MTHDVRRIHCERVEQVHEVGHGVEDVIAGHVGGSPRPAEASLVEGEHPVAGVGECRDLVTPELVGVGPAVDEDDRDTVGRTRLDHEELQAVAGDRVLGRHRSSHRHRVARSPKSS